MMLGLRGFPGVQGGIETHAEHLCPLLAELGCKVDVIVRSRYQHSELGSTWKKVNFHPLWCPKSKGVEAIVHTLLGVLYAGFVNRPDILHIHAIGPAIMTPLARLLGLKVVFTHHGPDYDRQKWGNFAKYVLKLGERLGIRWSNGRIVLSEVICSIAGDIHSNETELIPNGVILPELPTSVGAPRSFGLTSGKYILMVGRLVPEKRHLDLIRAFREANLPQWHLALVGSSDHPDDYTRNVFREATTVPRVVCTGFQSGLALRELYAHAGVFVLPSSHEGLPIALLEALSYGLPVIASAIPANLEVGLPPEHYFLLGNISSLAERLVAFSGQPISDGDRSDRRQWVAERFNWTVIAERTLALYKRVLRM